MKKAILATVACAVVGTTAWMLYAHRGVIKAAIKGEPLPEAPEGCPAYKGE